MHRLSPPLLSPRRAGRRRGRARLAHTSWTVALAVALAGALAGATGCAGSRAPADAPAHDSGLQGSWSKFTADARVGRYTSSPWGFSTASYWIEGPEGVVIVDTQFLPSATRELIAIAERETGKRVVTAVVLHANPDKFNGTATLQERGVEVVTSQQVADLIPAVHKKRVDAFYERYQPDYPASEPKPASFGDQTTTLRAAGLELTAHVVGAGCSAAHVVLEFEGHLFAGDLVANGVHSWLEIGQTEAWLERVAEMTALKPRHVHPGRGASGGPELLANQRAYLEHVIASVAAEEPRGKATPEALARARERIVSRYPDHDFAVFLDIGLPAEWRRQVAARQPR